MINEIRGKNPSFDNAVKLDMLIGQGSSGYTFEGEIILTGSKVALKYITSDSPLYRKFTKEQFQYAVMNEVTLQYNVVHPNVCKFLGYYKIGENCIMVMELCQYGTVKEFYKYFKQFTKTEYN